MALPQNYGNIRCCAELMTFLSRVAHLAQWAKGIPVSQ